jgi:Ca2+-binding RTX toxin-like protein
LELPELFTITSFGGGGISNALRKTPEAIAAGFTISDTDLSDGVPYHNVFTGPAGFNGLDIFVLDTGPDNIADDIPPSDDRAVTLGQGSINNTVGGGPTTTISGNQMTLINLGGKPLLNLNALGGTDAITVDGTTLSLDGLLAPLAIHGGGNGDSLLIDDSADNVGGDAVSVTSLSTTGLAAFPISYVGIGPLSVRATQGADALNLDFSAAGPSSVHIFGGLSGDLFTGPSGYMQPTATIPISVHGGVLAATPGPGLPFNPFGEPGDNFNLDMTTRANGTPVNPVVIVDTNGGNAVSSNTQLVRFTGIENIDVLDGGVLTNTAIGDFYLRGVDGAPDYIEFRSAAQVNPTFRVRVGNTYYPSSTGEFGPYMTATGKVYVYGRGGNDTITMFNTRVDAVIFGEAGNDVITGGYGNDLLIGGQGDDRLNGAAVGGNDEVWGDDFDPVLDVPSVASQAAGGNDQISTFGGNDTVYGQGGNDIINTGGGADYVNGGPGDDQMNGQAGDDRLYGGSGIDNINGSDGHDLVAGNAGNDTLIGELGNDILIGGLGADTVNGGAGGDVVVGDESNNAGGSGSLAKNDIADAALLALLTAWGTSPVLGSLLGFNSAGTDGSVDTLWGGTQADAFFNTATDVAADKNAFGYGPDL